MHTMNVHDLPGTMSQLKGILAVEHEPLLVSNGETIARMTSVERRRPPLSSLKAFRAEQPMIHRPIEVLIREERDRR